MIVKFSQNSCMIISALKNKIKSNRQKRLQVTGLGLR